MINEDNLNSGTFSLVRDHLEGQARSYHSKAALYQMGGIASIIALFWIGVSMAILGYSTLQQKSDAAERIGNAIVKSISKTPIRVETSGTVTVDHGSKVALLPNATISLTPNQFVQIDPSSSLKIATPSVTDGPRPSTTQLQISDTDKLGEISTSYVIFHSTSYKNGAVENAWIYSSSDREMPIQQTCKFMIGAGNQKQKRIPLAVNGEAIDHARKLAGLDYSGALQLCVWADGTTTRGSMPPRSILGATI